ncbi:MAG: hypothetical protein K2N73_06870 [Lachnospiraceae bacterium]|nr:hypothetical protein [Lachnospiraceae bacterium]
MEFIEEFFRACEDISYDFKCLCNETREDFRELVADFDESMEGTRQFCNGVKTACEVINFVVSLSK